MTDRLSETTLRVALALDPAELRRKMEFEMQPMLLVARWTASLSRNDAVRCIDAKLRELRSLSEPGESR